MEPYSKLTVQFVRVLWKESGLTVKQFADKIGYSRRRVVEIIDKMEASEHITIRLEQRLSTTFNLDGDSVTALNSIGSSNALQKPYKPRQEFDWADGTSCAEQLKPFFAAVVPLLEAADRRKGKAYS